MRKYTFIFIIFIILMTYILHQEVSCLYGNAPPPPINSVTIVYDINKNVLNELSTNDVVEYGTVIVYDCSS